MKFGSYWFETGTPTYLVELLKKSNYNLQHITHEETDADVLNSIDRLPVIPFRSFTKAAILLSKDSTTVLGFIV